MATLTDTFTAADGTLLTAHTGDDGQGYVLPTTALITGGAPTITGGAVVWDDVGNASTYLGAFLDQRPTDEDLDITWHHRNQVGGQNPPGTTGRHDLIFRYLDDDNYCLLGLTGGTGTPIEYTRVVAGVTAVDHVQIGTMPDNADLVVVDLRFEIVGQVIKVYDRWGSLRITYTDTGYTAGVLGRDVGTRAYDSGANAAYAWELHSYTLTASAFEASTLGGGTPPGPSGPWVPPGREMAEADYAPLGVWRVERWRQGRDTARLDLTEPKTAARAEVPTAPFTRGALDETAYTYPDLADDAEGQVAPIAYGTVRGCRAWCVDVGARRFRVLAHAVARFERFRLASGGAFTPTTIDPATASFVWADWDGTQQLVVDLTAPLANPADVIEDLLTTWAGLAAGALHTPGAADPEAGRRGFGADGSRAAWVLGTDRYGAEVCAPAISLYVDDPTEALKLAEQVAAAAAGVLTHTAAGALTLIAWEPLGGADAVELRTHEVEPTAEVRADALVSRVVGRYAKDHAADDTQAVTLTRDEVRYRHGLTAHASVEQTLPLSRRADADAWCSRTLAMDEAPRRVWDVEAGPRALTLLPGDCVRLTWGRPTRTGVTAEATPEELYGLYEVLEVTARPGDGLTRLRLTDWRGLARAGHVPADPVSFPASLGGGSGDPWDPAWTQAQRRYAAEHWMYVTDEHGFVDPTDPESYRVGVIAP